MVNGKVLAQLDEVDLRFSVIDARDCENVAAGTTDDESEAKVNSDAVLGRAMSALVNG